MRLLAGFLLLCVVVPLQAHRVQYSLSQMDWRVDAGRLEIVHSVHLDDAMVVLAHLGDPQGVLDARTKAKLLLYVEQNFKLGVEQQALPVEPIGAEIRGDFLWIYQEIELAVYPQRLEVQCRLFQDWFPEQRNQVNYVIGDQVKTRYFSRDQAIQSFE